MRYHAARGLIYLGCLDVGGVYLFKRVPGTLEYKALESSSLNSFQDSSPPPPPSENPMDTFDGNAKCYCSTLILEGLCSA